MVLFNGLGWMEFILYSDGKYKENLYSSPQWMPHDINERSQTAHALKLSIVPFTCVIVVSGSCLCAHCLSHLVNHIFTTI